MGVTLQLPTLYGEKLQSMVKYLSTKAEILGLQEIWLFGSLARGSNHVDSDIDIMLIVEDDSRRIQRTIEDLQISDTDFPDADAYPEVDISVRTLEMLQSELYVFNQYVLQDKIVLWQRKGVI